MEINRDMLRNFRHDLDSALLQLSAKYNVSIRGGNARFTANQATMKLEIAKIDTTTGEVLTKEATAYKLSAASLGLKPSLLNQPININGMHCKITGYSRRAHRYPILLTLDNGTIHKCTVSYVIANYPAAKL